MLVIYFATVTQAFCHTLYIIVFVYVCFRKCTDSFLQCQVFRKIFCKNNYRAKNAKILRFSPNLRLSN